MNELPITRSMGRVNYPVKSVFVIQIFLQMTSAGNMRVRFMFRLSSVQAWL